MMGAAWDGFKAGFNTVNEVLRPTKFIHWLMRSLKKFRISPKNIAVGAPKIDERHGEPLTKVDCACAHRACISGPVNLPMYRVYMGQYGCSIFQQIYEVKSDTSPKRCEMKP